METELKPQTTILDGIMGRILEKIAGRLSVPAGIVAGLGILAVYLFHHVSWK